MGFNKDAVVVADIPWKYKINKLYKDKQLALMNELKTIPGIRNISLGSAPLQSAYNSSPYKYSEAGKKPVSRQLFNKWVDTNYINLYEMKLLAGRNLFPSDTTSELVLNEAAMTAYGFTSPQEAVGKMLKQGNRLVPIVGVIRDFHLQNFYTRIEPAALMCNKANLSTFNIKLYKDHPEQWQSVLQAVENKWNGFYPSGSFTYSFYDDTIRQLYKEERNLSKLINLATAVAIFISCLGLLGLATLTAFQRTKEIGIRKVLGSSVFGIVQTLCRQYVWLVLIAFIIATPVAWWTMHKWLEKFVYRVEVQWWMFALSGLIAIAIALLTVSFQAIKAAMVNPVKSLRTE
jgi:ABC-type antimicrobial peptide transport system permease subunit